MKIFIENTKVESFHTLFNIPIIIQRSNKKWKGMWRKHEASCRVADSDSFCEHVISILTVAPTNCLYFTNPIFSFSTPKKINYATMPSFLIANLFLSYTNKGSKAKNHVKHHDFQICASDIFLSTLVNTYIKNFFYFTGRNLKESHSYSNRKW